MDIYDEKIKEWVELSESTYFPSNTERKVIQDHYLVGFDILFKNLYRLNGEQINTLWNELSRLYYQNTNALRYDYKASIEYISGRIVHDNHKCNENFIDFVELHFNFPDNTINIPIMKVINVFSEYILNPNRCFCNGCKIKMYRILIAFTQSIFHPDFINLSQTYIVRTSYDCLGKFFSRYFKKSITYDDIDEEIINNLFSKFMATIETHFKPRILIEIHIFMKLSKSIIFYIKNCPQNLYSKATIKNLLSDTTLIIENILINHMTGYIKNPNYKKTYYKYLAELHTFIINIEYLKSQSFAYCYFLKDYSQLIVMDRKVINRKTFQGLFDLFIDTCFQANNNYIVFWILSPLLLLNFTKKPNHKLRKIKNFNRIYGQILNILPILINQLLCSRLDEQNFQTVVHYYVNFMFYLIYTHRRHIINNIHEYKKSLDYLSALLYQFADYYPDNDIMFYSTVFLYFLIDAILNEIDVDDIITPSVSMKNYIKIYYNLTSNDWLIDDWSVNIISKSFYIEDVEIWATCKYSIFDKELIKYAINYIWNVFECDPYKLQLQDGLIQKVRNFIVEAGELTDPQMIKNSLFSSDFFSTESEI